MNDIHAVMALLEILLIGLLASWAFKLTPRCMAASFLPAAWSLGALIVAGLCFVCGILGHLSAARWLVPVLGLAAFAFILWRRRRENGTSEAEQSGRSEAERFLPGEASVAASSRWPLAWLLLPAVFLVVGWTHEADRLYAGDELFIWGRRAVIAVQADDLGAGYRKRVEAAAAGGELSHADYPLLNTLLQAWMLDDEARLEATSRLPIHAFDFFALILLGGLVASATRNPLLLVFFTVLPFLTVWYATLPAMSDRILAFGFLMTLAGLGGDGRRASRALVTLGLLLLVTSKNEGLVLALASGAARLALVKREGAPRGAEFIRLLRLGLPALLALATHWLWARHHGFENDMVPMGEGGVFAVLFQPVTLARIPALLKLVVSDFLTDPFAALYLPLAVPALALLNIGSMRRSPAALLVLGSSALVVLVYFVVFLATPHDLKWHWSTAGPRIMGQVNLALAWAAAMLASCLLAGRPANAKAGA